VSVQYDPFSEEVMADPHPIYKRLRDEAPAYRIEKYNAWALSRFEDVWNASLMTEALITSKGTTSAQVLTKVQPVTPMINTMDPPAHTELRTQIRRFFMPGAVRQWEAKIGAVVDACFERFRGAGRCDVMGDFASVVSTSTACMFVGIPLEDANQLNDLVWRFFKREPGIDGMTPDGLAAMMELNQYFQDLIKTRRAQPERDDIVNMLLNIEIGGEKLGDDAIGSHLSMLIIGGSETFPKTFANVIRRLGEHPDQRAACAADFSLIPDAYMEGLRYDMPTQFLCRTVAKPVTFHGQTFREGEGVCLLYTSANRDEREFPDPDRFDIRRRAPRILSFGQGIHLCLGMHVAKLEAKLCLEKTLRYMPEYEVDLKNAVRQRTDFVQGYASLPITFRPA
jgi:cytochrome P450